MPEQTRCKGRRTVWILAMAMTVAGAGLTGDVVTPETARAQVQLAQEMKMEMATEGLFEGRGEVIALIPDKIQIVVGHEEIEGFMKAMPMGMGYDLESAALLTGLQPGDKITFTIDAAKKKIIKIIPASAN